MTRPAWHYLSRSLEAAGEVERAYSILEDAAAAGSTEALVSLAMLKWKRGSLAEADANMFRAEARVHEEDWEAHFALHVAYLIGIGGSNPALRLDRAFSHLVAAAQTSDQARMAYSVGLHYWQGLNEVQVNFEKADHWLGLAASSGDKEIVRQYKRFRRQFPKPRKPAV